jgi:hypothetical protein
VARRRGSLVPTVAVDIPPDLRRSGPLTSDDRGWGDDFTRGGDIECSEVLGGRGGREIGVKTVKARDLPYNPYGIGAHEDGEET